MNWYVAIMAVLLSAFVTRQAPAASPNPVDAEVSTLLREHMEKPGHPTGIVVGVVDATGARVFSYGKQDTGDSPPVDGDTLFEIGSVSKVFTGLLLELMVERGEMGLDDPISKFLPAYVKIPHSGTREITLRHLVTHTSGLPRFPPNVDRTADDPFADYTAERLYSFLIHFTTPDDIGTRFEYSNVGIGLLGHLISLRAGTSYESLLVSQICQPLGMNQTRITLSPELNGRRARGYTEDGAPSRKFNAPLFVGSGGIVSSANDMVKFLSANLGLTNSSLATSMQKTQEVCFAGDGHRVGLGWLYPMNAGSEVIAHGGRTRGYRSMLAIDKRKGRGVVVLSNSTVPIGDIAWRLLGVQGRRLSFHE
jgi:D-alanyl-D-alanine-carboxypeptidase/D-alanyl-D-alanine-endopeptidase